MATKKDGKKTKKRRKNPSAVKLGHRRARKLTAERRREIASYASRKRWAKYYEQRKSNEG